MAAFEKSLKDFFTKIPDETSILNDHQKVQDDFNLILSRIDKIKWVIVAEAPQSHLGYIYNPDNQNESVFLRSTDLPEHLISSKKEKLIDTLIDYGILIIDLYPLPLPSAFYADTSFYHPDDLVSYWNSIISRIGSKVSENPRIALRYKKFDGNKIFENFKELFFEKFPSNNENVHCFAGTNMALDKAKFSQLFK